MKQRIEYIDALKGFAIFLVVLGHTIGWQFSDFQRFDMGGVNLLWQVIYSFHMPLFMFCSGLFFPPYDNNGFKVVYDSIKKRFLTLMVPYITMGVLGHLFFSRSYFLYWFLITLFLFFLLNTIIVCLLHKLKLDGPVHEAFSYFFFSIAILLISYKFSFMYQGVGILNLTVYPYFCLGILFSRFKLAEKWLSKNWLYSLAIPLFMVSFFFYVYANLHGPLRLLAGMLTATSGIFASLYLFKHIQGRMMRWFNYLGKYTLEIYLLHFIFLVHLPFFGDFYQHQYAIFGFGGSFVPQLIVSMILTMTNIILCITLKEIITQSNLLSRLLLGRASNK